MILGQYDGRGDGCPSLGILLVACTEANRRLRRASSCERGLMPLVRVRASAGVAGQRRSSRITTRGNPPETERVSAALAKPVSSKSLRVPT